MVGKVGLLHGNLEVVVTSISMHAGSLVLDVRGRFSLAQDDDVVWNVALLVPSCANTLCSVDGLTR